VAREQQLVERQMQELVVPKRDWKTSRPPELATDSVSGASWAKQMLL
jgi:hypothetical protein